MIEAWVDGSFANGLCGWGVVICDGPYDRRTVLFEANGVVDDHGHRQIGGEVKSSMMAVAWAIKNKAVEIVVHYDYEGVQKWATGEWNAKKDLTRAYGQWMRNQVERFGLLIYWKHVRSHSGDPGNDRADYLARRATRREKP